MGDPWIKKETYVMPRIIIIGKVTLSYAEKKILKYTLYVLFQIT